MKLCDITQFYSPFSGGVKRYLHQKIDYLRRATTDEHLLIVPGAKTECTDAERSRTYFIRSPIVSPTLEYRALINLPAVYDRLKRERPDVIECADPYQLAWTTIFAARRLRIPVLGFYHSHFPEAYLRGPAETFAKPLTDSLMSLARSYVRKLYNSFELTLVASDWLAETLRAWGVGNVRVVTLGVDTSMFTPERHDADISRAELGVRTSGRLLLYVGRLSNEKNVGTLFRSFELLHASAPERFQLLVVGDGPARSEITRLQSAYQSVIWIPYCAEPQQLARYYRAADLFVHPSTEETFGLVRLESEACGTPVLGIRGSRSAVAPDDDGLWAPENTPESLANAIKAACERDLEQLGLKARDRVARCFSWDRVFDQLFSIYREVYTGYTTRS